MTALFDPFADADLDDYAAISNEFACGLDILAGKPV